MKNMTLVIPTHGRVRKQITLNALPTALQKEVVLVSSLPAEAKELQSLYPDNEVAVARGTDSIASKRHWIMNNIHGNVLFMMDDDIAFFERCPEAHRTWMGGQWKLKDPNDPVRLMYRLYPGDKRLLSHFKTVDAYVGKNDLQMVCVKDRRHSDKIQETWSSNGRMMYAFGVGKEVYKKHKVRFDAVRCREDFHVTLALLRKGVENRVYNELLLNVYQNFGAGGGCSTERTLTQSDDQCFVLQKLHPQFVKVVDRVYDTTASRKEVVVKWKAAYESSKKK